MNIFGVEFKPLIVVTIAGLVVIAVTITIKLSFSRSKITRNGEDSQSAINSGAGNINQNR